MQLALLGLADLRQAKQRLVLMELNTGGWWKKAQFVRRNHAEPLDRPASQNVHWMFCNRLPDGRLPTERRGAHQAHRGNYQVLLKPWNQWLVAHCQ